MSAVQTSAVNALVDEVLAVIQRRNLNELRVPPLYKGMQVDAIIDRFEEKKTNLRVACFGFALSEKERSIDVTTSVSVALQWRNEPSSHHVRTPMIIIGSINESGRAAGLSSVVTINHGEVERRLFEKVDSELRDSSVPQRTRKLLSSLRKFTKLNDLGSIGDYLDTVASADPGKAGEVAQKSLWRVGLLPDLTNEEIDIKRIRENWDLVRLLRSLDSNKVVRVVGSAGQMKGDYRSLKYFSDHGDPAYLKGLVFEGVKSALKESQNKPKKKGKIKNNSETEESEISQFTDIVLNEEHDQENFENATKDPEEESPNTVTLGDKDFSWNRVSLDRFGSLLGDGDKDLDVLHHPISEEDLSNEEDPRPGHGDVTWTSVEKLRKRLVRLKERSGEAGDPVNYFDQVMEARTVLRDYVGSLPREGLRLFLGSERLRQTGINLLNSWLDLWNELSLVRSSIPGDDVAFLSDVAVELARFDTRVFRTQKGLGVQLLPLHPFVIEPRVRAAEVLNSDQALANKMYELISEGIDPAIPSLSVRMEGTSYTLPYSKQNCDLPQYTTWNARFQSADVYRNLVDVAQRFVSVHPYAELSLHITLIDPEPQVVSKFIKAIVVSGRAEKVTIDIYVRSIPEQEIREALDETEESLVNQEISQGRYRVQVFPVDSLQSILDWIKRTERSPHLVFLFDVSQYETNVSGVADRRPMLGSLVSEWQFKTDLDVRPIIQPRPGSTKISSLLTSQSEVLSDPWPTLRQLPLVPDDQREFISNLSGKSTWVSLIQGGSALVAPTSIGDMELVGRSGSGAHYSYIYTSEPRFLMEPVLKYLNQIFFNKPEKDQLQQFLYETLVDGLPEGLLSFFKQKGSLAPASLAGRVGFASALRALKDEAYAEGGIRLIISLDSEGARNWLGLRDDSNQRADLVVITLEEDRAQVDAVEVKTRTSVSTSSAAKEIADEAEPQVQEVLRLLGQVLLKEEEDVLTPSRLEILKRQVFVEALQQWESCRNTAPQEYEKRITLLNRLFTRETSVQIDKRIFVVTPEIDAEEIELDNSSGTKTRVIGIDWLQAQLKRHKGAFEEIDSELLNGFLGEEEEDNRGIAQKEGGLGATPHHANGEITSHENECSSKEHDHSEDDASVEQKNMEGYTGNKSGFSTQGNSEGVERANALRDALVARKAPILSVEDDEIKVGPSVIQIPFRVKAGSRLSSLQSQQDDLARDMGVTAVRITNYSGRAGYAVAEVPRVNREIPHVTSLSPSHDEPYLSIALGMTVEGEPYWVALDELPHLLVGGTTGSGKSIFLRSILYQLTNHHGPEDLELVIIDGKGMADYIDFKNTPHLRNESDYCREPESALDLLEEIVESRLPEKKELFLEEAESVNRETGKVISSIRDLLNSKKDAKSRPLVVVMDEFAELAMTTSDRKRFENLVTRFNQVARALGGHMIAATQRPSADVVAGVAKANFSRVALRVQSGVDSRVIIDEVGAENLLGHGDLLFNSGSGGIVRLQGLNSK